MRGTAFSFAVIPSFTIPLTRPALHPALLLAENEQPPAGLEPAVHPDK
jgi:hypothetical protein